MTLSTEDLPQVAMAATKAGMVTPMETRVAMAPVEAMVEVLPLMVVVAVATEVELLCRDREVATQMRGPFLLETSGSMQKNLTSLMFLEKTD